MTLKGTPGIAIASCGLGHVARGIETWAGDLAQALRNRDVPARLYQGSGRANHPLDCVVGCWPRDSKPTQIALGCVPRRVGWRWGWGSPYAIEQMTFAKRLIGHLRRDETRLLHVQDPLVARHVQRAYHRGIVPTRVILGHGTEESVEFRRGIDYLQEIGPWHLQQILNDLGEPAQHAHSRGNWLSIGNFVDTESFRPGKDLAFRRELNIPENAQVAICVAAIKRNHKRIDHLIEEVADLNQRRPDLPLWLVVAGAREVDTPGLIEEGHRRLGERVKFVVDLPRQRMSQLYRMSDIFVMTSLFEMMPIAVLEATGCGLPCVVHDHPVLKWMTGPGGLPVDMAKPGALSHQLETLMLNPDLRVSIGQQARDYCIANFSESVILKQLMDYYEHVLQVGQGQQVA